MSDSHRKHLAPREQAKRGPVSRAEELSQPRSLKSAKQKRSNQRTRLKREWL